MSDSASPPPKRAGKAARKGKSAAAPERTGVAPQKVRAPQPQPPPSIGASPSSEVPPRWTTFLSWGLVFDLATILISVVDVVSDVAVAAQFFQGGHMLWFWLVAASLVISSGCYATLTMHLADRDPFPVRLRGRNKAVRFALAILISPAMPTLRCWSERKKRSLAAEEAADRDWLRVWGVDADSLSRAAKEEFAFMKEARLTVEEMQVSSMKSHTPSYAFFYVQTVVESIPQSIIQLLAITWLGEPTQLQLFSLSVSVASIISKAYLINEFSSTDSVFDLRLYVAKFLLAAHDVFSLFYVFSTVLSPSRSQDFQLPLLSSSGSGLSWWWVFKLEVCSGLIIVGCLACCLVYVRHEHAYILLPGFVGGLTVLLIPGVLALEGTKIVLFALLFHILALPELHIYGWSDALALRTFIYNATSSEERLARTRYIFGRWMRDDSLTDAFSHSPSRVLLRERIIAATSDGATAKERNDVGAFSIFWEVTFDALKPDLTELLLTSAVSRLRSLSVALSTGGWRTASAAVWEAVTSIELYATAWLLLTVASCVAGALFSTAFPFLNAYHYGSQHNAFQWFCFGGVLLCVGGLIPLLPSLYRCVYIALAFGELLGARYFPYYCTRNLLRWIADYHRPAKNRILLASIPSGLLPADVVSHLSLFTADDHIDTKTLSLQEIALVN